MLICAWRVRQQADVTLVVSPVEENKFDPFLRQRGKKTDDDGCIEGRAVEIVVETVNPNLILSIFLLPLC